MSIVLLVYGVLRFRGGKLHFHFAHQHGANHQNRNNSARSKHSSLSALRRRPFVLPETASKCNRWGVGLKQRVFTLKDFHAANLCWRQRDTASTEQLCVGHLTLQSACLSLLNSIHSCTLSGSSAAIVVFRVLLLCVAPCDGCSQSSGRFSL